jgi:HlyD family secretion protein
MSIGRHLLNEAASPIGDRNMTVTSRWLPSIGAVAVLFGVVILAWHYVQPRQLGKEFASGRGRIEAAEVDIVAKNAGRIRGIFVNEGDLITGGQVLAEMETEDLESQRREAEAQLQEAQDAVERARNLVTQRQAEKSAAIALMTQRKTDLDMARNRPVRSEPPPSEQAVAGLYGDQAQAAVQSAESAFAAAQTQLAAAQVAIITATSQVLEAESGVRARLAADGTVAGRDQ